MRKSNQTLLILLCLLFTCPLYSQDYKILKNGVVMKDGKAMKADKNGALTPLDADVTLGNGTVVTKAGEYKLPNGKKIKMKNGEAFSEGGNMLVLSDELMPIEGFVMKNGMVVQIKGASISPLEQDLTLESGDKIMKDGSLVRKDGVTIFLSEGEMINMKGEMVRRKDEFINIDGVTMRDGKMMKWENNKLIPVDKEIILTNGAKISPDGSITLKDGTKLTLNNSEIFTSKGDIAIAKTDLIMDGLVKRGDNMMLLQNGKIKMLSQDMTLANGAVVTGKGILASSNGTKLELREGDVVSLNGDVMLSKGGNAESASGDDRSSTDHIVFENGKITLVKNGQPQNLDKEMAMANGSKIYKNGQVIKKDGSKYMMKEGERMDMNGEMIVDKDKQAADEKNHVAMKMGKMMIVKNGKESPLTSEVLLADWSKVQPDGSLLKENGQKYQFKEGERMNMDGEMMAKAGSGAAVATASDCIQMKDGKVCIVKDGKSTPLIKEQIMPNGSKVLATGKLVKKDGSIIALKEGDRVDMKGELIPKGK